MREQLLVLTGGPGTGKTYTVKQIVEGWRRRGKRVVLACPTARAATVLASTVGSPASTIHRLLEYNPQEEEYKRNQLRPLEADAIVVDEASMLDLFLAAKLLDALPIHTCVLLVGDSDQLPSVGPGSVLLDLLSASRVPRVTLDTIFRQDPSGDIARTAQLVNRGLPLTHLLHTPPKGVRPGGCLFVPAADEAAAAEIICGGLLDWLKRAEYDLDTELQVLAPLKLGAAGTYALNRRLKQRLNPGVGREAELGVSVGDQMIQLTNDYESLVFNGDIGRVTAVRPGRGARFTVCFDQREALTRGSSDEAESSGVEVEYGAKALGRDVALSYALTVHKSQGSEYPVVVLPVLPQHGRMLYRNLFYTGISRAKQLLVLVGSEEAIAAAVGNNAMQRRDTMLTERVADDEVAPFCAKHE
jgi:exodeoxyribonuclease V alpha subunit